MSSLEHEHRAPLLLNRRDRWRRRAPLLLSFMGGLLVQALFARLFLFRLAVGPEFFISAAVAFCIGGLVVVFSRDRWVSVILFISLGIMAGWLLLRGYFVYPRVRPMPAAFFRSGMPLHESIGLLGGIVIMHLSIESLRFALTFFSAILGGTVVQWVLNRGNMLAWPLGKSIRAGRFKQTG